MLHCGKRESKVAPLQNFKNFECGYTYIFSQSGFGRCFVATPRLKHFPNQEINCENEGGETLAAIVERNVAGMPIDLL